MSVEKSYRQGPEWTDPHPYDMGPGERAAYANGHAAGKRESAAEIERLHAPWQNADEVDWTHLDNLLGYSGHGQFWRAVLKEVRAALACRQ